MGSLTSRPKVPDIIQAPSQPQVVYVPSSSGGGYVSSPAPSIPVTNNDAGEDNPDTPVVTSNADTEVRITNLLRRNRGLSGTIQTGFRGLLSANELIPQRKTLLGE